MTKATLYCVGVMLGICLLTAYAMPGFEVSDNDTVTDPGILAQCRDNVHGFMLELIPDDRNCNRYYHCIYSASGSGATEPTLKPCAPSGNGTQLLYYDFRNCQCEFSNEGCYTGNDADVADYFICAVPANSSGETVVFE